jgi:translation initiation factor 2A
MKVSWNSKGNSLLVSPQTEMDKTGASYYGETTLYLLHCDGRESIALETGRAGAIHDFAWSPTGTNFVVIAGRTPPMATVRYICFNLIFLFM